MQGWETLISEGTEKTWKNRNENFTKRSKSKYIKGEVCLGFPLACR